MGPAVLQKTLCHVPPDLLPQGSWPRPFTLLDCSPTCDLVCSKMKDTALHFHTKFLQNCTQNAHAVPVSLLRKWAPVCPGRSAVKRNHLQTCKQTSCFFFLSITLPVLNLPLFTDDNLSGHPFTYLLTPTAAPVFVYN